MNDEKEKEPTSSANDVSSAISDSTEPSPNLCENHSTIDSEKQDKLKGRHFWYVVYPESAPKDWVEQLRQTGLAFCVSPLHDKDVNPDGTTKKPHYHVIVSWSNSTTYRSARSLCDEILKCPRPQILKNPTGAYRYHQHKDNPEKFQYEEASKTYNGWKRPIDSNEVTEIKRWIYQAIYIEDCQEYGELLTVCLAEGPEYFDVASNNTMYCSKLCQSYRNNPIRGLIRFYYSLEEGSIKEQIGERIQQLTGGKQS